MNEQETITPDFANSVDLQDTDGGEAIATATTPDFINSVDEASVQEKPFKKQWLGDVDPAIVEERKREFIEERMKHYEGPPEFIDKMRNQEEFEWETAQRPLEFAVKGMINASLPVAGGEALALSVAAKSVIPIAKFVGTLAAFHGLDYVYNLERFVQYKFPNTSAKVLDVVGFLDFASKIGVMGAGVAGYKKIMKAKLEAKNVRNVNIAPEELAKVKANPNLLPEEKADIVKTLGIEDKQIESSLASGAPVNVPIEKVVDLSTKPYWERTKQELLAEATKQPELGPKQAQGEAIAPGKGRVPTSKGMSAQEALNYLKGTKVKLKSSSGKIGQELGQTGVEGIYKETLDVAKNFSEKYGVDVTITGGTEIGHAPGEISHGAGRKLDFGIPSNPKMSEIVEKWQSAGTRNNKGKIEPGYIDPDTGAIFWKERNHWDVEVAPKLSTSTGEGQFKKGADSFDTESVESIIKDLKDTAKEYSQKIRKVNDNISVEEVPFNKLNRIKTKPDKRLANLEKLGKTDYVTVIKEGSYYRVVDGQHRITLAEKQGKTSLKMIVANSDKNMSIEEIKSNFGEGQKPSGIGSGSILNTPNQLDFTTKREITSEMPFALLGNKADVIARLPDKLKTDITKGVKKVFDLWGGAKGYRIGLFKNIKSENYHLNEFSNERSNYYKNVKDAVAHKAVIKHIAELKDGLIDRIANAFDINPDKYPPEYLKTALNKWLGEKMSNERYQYVRDVVQKYGEELLKEAQGDNFASPESSAKYYFLENTSLFGLSQDAKGYNWTQGIVRKSKGQASLKEAITRLEKASELISNEHTRDKNINLTQDDAWKQMDKVTADIKAGKLKAKETVVLADPQYLNPSVEEGTYSVGRSDTTWAGHKQNLEKHLLPLIKTGAKVIYTNNLDANLTAWLKENNIPYNVETGVGAAFGKGGRNEIISFINYDLPGGYTSGDIIQGGGVTAGAGEIFSESATYRKWLEENKAQIEAGGFSSSATSGLIKSMKELATNKELSQDTVTRLKKFLEIENLSKATEPQIKQITKMIGDLSKGDKFLSENQLKGLNEIIKDLPSPEVTPKRVIIDKFGEKRMIMDKGFVSKVPPEMMPTVDIKEGHPEISKIVEKASDLIGKAEDAQRMRDTKLDKMLTKAEKSRAKLLPTTEKLKRKLIPQNKEIFQALSGEKVELTKDEVAVVAYLKNFFKMVKENLALEKFRKNYITHLEKSLTEKILDKGLLQGIKETLSGQKANDIPTDIMLELDNIIGSEKFFKFALERKGGIDPTTNIRRIIHQYGSLYENKMALDQVLPEGQAVTKVLLKGKSAMWLKRYLQNLKGRGLDQNFRTGPGGWLTKVADTAVDIGYQKLLGLNWKSALKNIVAGETNSWIFQDFPTYMKGKERFYSNPKKAYKIATENNILEGTYADFSQKGIGSLKKLQDISMIGQKLGEVEIRSSIMASMLTDKEWKSGKIDPLNLQKIKDTIAITQGIFSRADSPLWVQAWYGRMFFQMNRWRITNAMLLRRITNDAVLDIRSGKYNTQSTTRLGKALVAYGVGMYVSYQLAQAGLKTASDVARNMAQTIDGVTSLVTEGELIKMFTENPTLTTFKEIFNTIQNTANYLHIPGVKKAREKGIEDTYIAPVKTGKAIIDTIEELY